MRLARVILLHPFGLTPKRPELPCFLAPTVKHVKPIASTTSSYDKPKQPKYSDAKESQSSTTPSEFPSKQQKGSKLKSPENWDRTNCGFDPKYDQDHYYKSADYQEVRCHGPLYRLSKGELNEDPETAKKQWRDLCKEHNEKQRVTAALWKEIYALKIRCRRAESRYAALRDVLDNLSKAGAQLGAENKVLRKDILEALQLTELY